MALTVTGALASGIVIATELIVDQIIDEARPHNVVAPLVHNDILPQGRGKVWEIEARSTVAPAGLAESSDITATQRTTTSANITVAEVGANTELTTMAMETANVGGDVMGWAAASGRGIAQLVTSNLCDLFVDLHGAVAIGTSGSDLTIANFLTSMYTLEAANAPGQKRCVLHPVQVTDLFSALTGSGAIYQNLPELIRDGRLPNGQPSAGFVGQLFGVPIYSTTEADASGTTTDVCGAMFVEMAMGFIQLRGITVELQRDASQRATEIVVTSAYGVGEIVDGYGVPIVTDAP